MMRLRAFGTELQLVKRIQPLPSRQSRGRDSIASTSPSSSHGVSSHSLGGRPGANAHPGPRGVSRSHWQ